MTARTRHGDSKDGFGNYIDLIVSEGDLFVVSIGNTKAMRHHAKVGGTDGRLIEAELLVDARFFKQVTGEVLVDELIIGNVGVDRAYDVVAILRRVGDVRIALATIGFSVAKPVHPIASPALSVVV